MADTVFEQGWVDERLGGLLTATGGDVDGAEVLFRGDEGHHLRLAESRVIQAGRVVEGRVTLRVLRDQREARASTTDLTDAGLRRCAARALDRVAAAPRSDEPLLLAAPAEVPAVPSRALDL